MLSAIDADLVRRDAALPGLATLLDPNALLAALRAAAGNRKLQSVQITYVKYKPGTNCLVGLRMDVGGTAVEGYATAYPLHVRDNERHVREGVPGPLGRGRFVLPNLAVVVSVFPNDSAVKSLDRVSDERRGEFLRKRFPFRPDLWEASMQRLAYKPERRYVGKLCVNERPLAVLKAYTAEGFTTAEANAKALQPRDALKLAPLVGGARGVLIFEWVSGRLLSEALLDESLDPKVIEHVGEALADLHAQDPDELTTCITRHEDAAELLHEASGLGRLYPRVAERAQELARRLVDRLAQHTAVSRPIHGDFHARQVLLVPDGVALVDLDRAVRADPAADLGVFIAHLERETVRGNLPRERISALRDALLESYWVKTREAFPERVDLYTAAEMLRLAPRFFRYWEPDWPDRTETLLARAETLCQKSAARVGVKGV